MKHDPNVTANATAVTVVLIYVVCAAAFILLPKLSMTFARSWFHGIALDRFGSAVVTAPSFVLGLVTATGGAWLVGYVFASLYNYFLKTSEKVCR